MGWDYYRKEVEPMIDLYLCEDEVADYINRQKDTILEAIGGLDGSWKHNTIIQELCEIALKTIHEWEEKSKIDKLATINIGRKTEKYTKWVEVMRLALFQYERFTEKRSAKSEALYSTLCSLAQLWGENDIKKIVVPGCGPGRTVLDFARLYPKAEVLGLDYSLLALILGDGIVCGKDNNKLLQRDVQAGDEISRIYNISGFGLENAKFGVINLITNQIPKCDMIICSNTLNLLSSQEKVIKGLVESLNVNGIIVFADLFGWRLDRQPDNRIIYDDISMIKVFEKYGLVTLDCFSGVPYVEAESGDQFAYYNEHFYVGKRV